MATKKTTTSTTRIGARRPAKKATSAARPSLDSPRAFSLHLGTGFSMLTERVGDGSMVSTRVPAGAILEVSYWKEPSAGKSGNVSTITFHARLDGTALTPSIIARRDDVGRLVRAPARLELPASCKQLEYWFELETDTGATLWDSNWGNNHWLELTTSSMNGVDAAVAPRAEA
jgi:hypothetical protein